MHVLLVDDDLDDQLLFTEAIARMNLPVTCKIANNGREGLDMLDEEPRPDFIFLDINMPVMNGFEFLQAMQQDPEGDNPPVCVLSTSHDVVIMNQAFALGAMRFLVKPTRFESLCTSLTEIIREARYIK